MHTTRHYCGARDYAAVSFTSEIDNLRIMGYFHAKVSLINRLSGSKILISIFVEKNSHTPLLLNIRN